jgi:hypothetical protein
MSLLYIPQKMSSDFHFILSLTLQSKMCLHEITFYTILCKSVSNFDRLVTKVLPNFSRTFFIKCHNHHLWRASAKTVLHFSHSSLMHTLSRCFEQPTKFFGILI